MLVKDYHINYEFYRWLSSTYSVIDFEIEVNEGEYIINVKFDALNDTITLNHDDLKIVSHTHCEKLYFKNIIIEKETIFKDKEVKHYPFLDQFFLNEIYCDMAIQLLKSNNKY